MLLRSAANRPEYSQVPASVYKGLNSPGQPLDSAASALMESRLGHNFSHVRVHTDSDADSSAKSINALAYTVGRDVVFAQGQFKPRTVNGQRLLAHELVHVVQQGSFSAAEESARAAAPPEHDVVGRSTQHVVEIRKAAPELVQRQPAPKPTFPGCTPANTLIDNPNGEMAAAVTFARNLVDAALAAIERNDKSENYQTALARHFINPTFSQVKDIHRNFRLIFFHLKPENFGCASSADDLTECEKITAEGFDEAFTPTTQGIAVGRSIVCPVFWFERLACRAVTLIHESAHAVGIGDGATHPPNRGSADYPSLAAAPPHGQTAALRMDNPDAYGFFAAQVGRETDTDCNAGGLGVPISPRDAIQIQGTAPKPAKDK